VGAQSVQWSQKGKTKTPSGRRRPGWCWHSSAVGGSPAWQPGLHHALLSPFRCKHCCPVLLRCSWQQILQPLWFEGLAKLSSEQELCAQGSCFCCCWQLGWESECRTLLGIKSTASFTPDVLNVPRCPQRCIWMREGWNLSHWAHQQLHMPTQQAWTCTALMQIGHQRVDGLRCCASSRSCGPYGVRDLFEL
jgi:hypothetical protein